MIQNLPLDIQKLPAPVEMIWFNRHNSGHKFTRVFLPPQEPGIDKATGEYTVDLLQNE